MPLSGLVLTFKTGEGLPETTLRFLREDSRITVGERARQWLSLAIETQDEAESRELHDYISSLPGVAYLDVVAVTFPELIEPPETNPRQ